MKSQYIIVLFFGILVGALALKLYFPTEKVIGSGENYIYLVYSPTCPHCEHLIEYLERTDLTNISIVLINGYKELGKYNDALEKYGIEVKGVPTTFAILNNGEAIVVSGFPSVYQDVDGYYGGKDREEYLCKTDWKGNPVYEDGKYLYCNVSGVLIGNKYSIDKLISLCKNVGCINLG